tara:strand:+ start:914 stop:1135 length:222 start_codon:yes stop_codon:yes gene_type:complete
MLAVLPLLNVVNADVYVSPTKVFEVSSAGTNSDSFVPVALVQATTEVALSSPHAVSHAPLSPPQASPQALAIY